MNQRVYRSTSEQMLGGVAAGLAHRMGLDPNLVRLGFVLGTFLTHGMLFFVYLALWALLPSSASTATNVGDTVRENVNEVAARFGVHSASPATPADPGTAASTAAPTPSTVLGNGQTIVRVLVIVGLIYALAMLGGMGAMFGSVHHMGHGGGGFIWPLLMILGVFWWLRRRHA
jgi:phage shock protein PspC (stress-responsive transcriptional regulator)